MQIDSHEVHPYKGAHKDKGNTDGNDIAALAPHGKKAHNKDDEDGFIEPFRKFTDGVLNNLGLVSYLGKIHSQGQFCLHFCCQFF